MGIRIGQDFRGYQGTHPLTTHYRTTTRGAATSLPYSSTVVAWIWPLRLALRLTSTIRALARRGQCALQKRKTLGKGFMIRHHNER